MLFGRRPAALLLSSQTFLTVVLTVSGRGDKDIETYLSYYQR